MWKRHPTALHDDNYQANVNRTAFAGRFYNDSTTTNSNIQNLSCKVTLPNERNTTILHAIIPVTVTNGENCIATYAFYDGGSGGCFMSCQLQQDLAASGVDTTIKLSTMHGDSFISTEIIRGLVVMDMDRNNKIYLPKTYVREDIPVKRNHIPRPNMLAKWPHLARRIAPYHPELSIGLLIGNDCPLAMEPQEVIPSSEGSPFAVRLRHGWTIHGPLEIQSSLTGTTCNRIALQEVTRTEEIILRMYTPHV